MVNGVAGRKSVWHRVAGQRVVCDPQCQTPVRLPAPWAVPMAGSDLFYWRDSRRTLGGIRPCRVGHLLGGPREHARAFRFLRALVVSHPRGDDRCWVC